MSTASQSALADFKEQILQAKQQQTILRIAGGQTKNWYGNNLQGSPLLTKSYQGILDYEPEESDNQLISGKINGLKNRISFIESTLTWVWYHSTDDKEKEQMILGYIKNQLDN